MPGLEGAVVGLSVAVGVLVLVYAGMCYVRNSDEFTKKASQL
jgi:hypothetical protein